MISLDNTALQQALQLAQQPELRLSMQKVPLPAGISELIRLISEDAGNRSTIAQDVQLSSDAFQQCLIDYYRTICLYPGSSPERMLALNPSSELRLAKEHHRLLIKWLHPDRNPEYAALAEQVNGAWGQLKAARSVPPPPKFESAAASGLKEWQPRAAPAIKSRFPMFLAVLACAGLALLLLATLPDGEIYSGTDERAGNTAEVSPVADVARDETPELNGLAAAAWAEPAQIQSAAQPAPVNVMPTPELPPQPAKAKSLQTQLPDNSTVLPVRSQAQPSPAASPPMPVRDEAAKAITLQEKTQEPIPLAKAPAPEAVVIPAVPVSQAEAAAVLQSFRQRYSQGNTQEFMRLFSSGARNNRGDRDAIEADYRRLFEASYFREVSLSKMQWQSAEDGLRVNAHFVSRVQRESDRVPVKNKGTLQFTFVRESGQVRIHRIILSP